MVFQTKSPNSPHFMQLWVLFVGDVVQSDGEMRGWLAGNVTGEKQTMLVRLSCLSLFSPPTQCHDRLQQGKHHNNSLPSHKVSRCGDIKIVFILNSFFLCSDNAGWVHLVQSAVRSVRIFSCKTSDSVCGLSLSHLSQQYKVHPSSVLFVSQFLLHETERARSLVLNRLIDTYCYKVVSKDWWETRYL